MIQLKILHFLKSFVFWRVGLGATHRANLRNFNSTQAIRHPQYNPQSRANDIGVITLNQLVVFTADIDRIALTPINDQQNIASWPMVNEEGSVAGNYENCFRKITCKNLSDWEFFRIWLHKCNIKRSQPRSIQRLPTSN